MTVAVDEYFLIPPNWANNVSYKRKWQTVVSKSLDASEQRAALFTWPRRTMIFTPLTKGFSELAYTKRKLHKNIHNIWGVPFWMDGTELTSQALHSQKVLNVGSTENRNFEVGALCVLYSSISSYEVGIIESKTANQIILQANLSNTWPKGTEVYPVLKARFKSGQIINLIGSRMASMEIEAEEEYEDSITRYIGEDDAFSTYLGYPVFDIKPNFVSPLEQGFNHVYSRLAYLGKSYDFSHYDETEFSFKADYLQKTKSELQSVLDFFDSVMGRWGNFWMPSWQADIRVTQGFGIGDNQLTIEDIDFSTYWLGEMAAKNITMLFPDGTRINRRVIAAPASDKITLNTPIGKECKSSKLDQLLVSFLSFARFNQDEIEIRYETSEIGETDLSFETLFTEAS